jgi:hypothetical protein
MTFVLTIQLMSIFSAILCKEAPYTFPDAVGDAYGTCLFGKALQKENVP